jgi:hypothetical protein
MPDSALKPLLLRNALDRIRAQGNTPTPPPQDDPGTLRGAAFNALFDVMGGNTDDQAKRSRATRTANMLAGSGRTVADFTPIVGDALAVGDARDAFKQGRYGEGALLGGLAALGMVPLVGDLAKKGGDELLDKSYRMAHRPPRPESGSVLNNLTDIYGDDIYGPNALRYFGMGSDYRKADTESINAIRKARNNPNAEVTVFRAVPKNVGDDILEGDWVSLSEEYAKKHGESALYGDYKIIKKKAKASELSTSGDALSEWGYWPSNQ